MISLLRNASLLILLGTGCAAPPGDPAQLAVQWRFADGRSCDTNGVAVVAIVSPPEVPFVTSCKQGLLGAVLLGEIPPGEQVLIAEGRSPSGAPLYRAEIPFLAEPGGAVELSFSFVFAQ